MRSTKFFCLLIACFFGALSASHASDDAGLHHCLKNDPNRELLHTAANNVYSFGYVKTAIHHALEAHPDAEACFSGVPLSKNMYQYYKFLVEFQVRSKSDGHVYNAFRLLYQDASTQANHNVGRSPWVGLDPKDARNVLKVLNEDKTYTDVLVKPNELDPIAIAKKSDLFKNTAASTREGTLSLYQLPANLSGDREKTYLVSWMVRTQGNGFAGFESPQGILVKIHENGRVRIAEERWLMSSVLFPLEEAVGATAKGLPYQQYGNRLLELSEVSH